MSGTMTELARLIFCAPEAAQIPRAEKRERLARLTRAERQQQERDALADEDCFRLEGAQAEWGES